MADLLKQNAAAPRPDVPVHPQDPAILLFNGGTTGTPKAALGTQYAFLTSAMQLQAYARNVLADRDDILTLVMPLFHVHGNMALYTALVARWPVAVIPNPRDIDDLAAALRKMHPACLHGVPTLFIAVINHPDVQSGKAGIQFMKICWSAAAPLIAEAKQRFQKLTGGWLLEAYSMTETMLAAACCSIHGTYKEGLVGVPLPDVNMRIVDIETGEHELPVGALGGVIVQAPQIMLGYWERPTETANLVREGPVHGRGERWVHTGDLGYIDEGAVFAFGLSERAHGADVYSTEMALTPQPDGTYRANGDKYNIGTGKIARIASTFGKRTDTGEYVFFAADRRHKNYELVQNVGNTQSYVAGFAARLSHHRR